MKSISFIISVLVATTILFTACSKDEEVEPTKESNSCASNDFGISIETHNIVFDQDSSWLTFYDGPGIQGDRKAWLGWDYPGWMVSNDIVFDYPNEGLDVGIYKVSLSTLGTIDFDGSGGSQFSCPCDSFFVEISHVDKTEGYCCGSFYGQALINGDKLEDVNGEFKAFLDGE